MEVIDRESRYHRVIGTCLCGTCHSQIYINADHPKGYCPNCLELAALRKQVEEGERDTKRLDWLGTENNFCFVDIVGVDKGSGLFNSNRQATMRTLREAIDAATPEPKEPANG
jgi:hypothetical protein